jgi:hypothetical protein
MIYFEIYVKKYQHLPFEAYPIPSLTIFTVLACFSRKFSSNTEQSSEDGAGHHGGRRRASGAIGYDCFCKLSRSKAKDIRFFDTFRG